MAATPAAARRSARAQLATLQRPRRRRQSRHRRTVMRSTLTLRPRLVATTIVHRATRPSVASVAVRRIPLSLVTLRLDGTLMTSRVEKFTISKVRLARGRRQDEDLSRADVGVVHVHSIRWRTIAAAVCSAVHARWSSRPRTRSAASLPVAPPRRRRRSASHRRRLRSARSSLSRLCSKSASR